MAMFACSRHSAHSVSRAGGLRSLPRYIVMPRYFISSFRGTRPTEQKVSSGQGCEVPGNDNTTQLESFLCLPIRRIRKVLRLGVSAKTGNAREENFNPFEYQESKTVYIYKELRQQWTFYLLIRSTCKDLHLLLQVAPFSLLLAIFQFRHPEIHFHIR